MQRLTSNFQLYIIIYITTRALQDHQRPEELSSHMVVQDVTLTGSSTFVVPVAQGVNIHQPLQRFTSSFDVIP